MVLGPNGEIFHVGQVGQDGKPAVTKLAALDTAFNASSGATVQPQPKTLAQAQQAGLSSLDKEGATGAPGLKDAGLDAGAALAPGLKSKPGL